MKDGFRTVCPITRRTCIEEEDLATICALSSETGSCQVAETLIAVEEAASRLSAAIGLNDGVGAHMAITTQTTIDNC